VFRLVTAAILSGLAALMAVGCAPTLAAPPHLVAVWPAAGTTLGVSPYQFELTFNRQIQLESSWAAVFRDDDGVLLPTGTSVAPDHPRQLNVRLDAPRPGPYQLQWHAVAAGGGAAAAGAVRFSIHGEYAGDVPRLEVTRSIANSGDQVEVAGRGFARQSSVQLTIGDDDEALASVETDPKGEFVVRARVPSAIPFGLQPVNAEDLRGSLATATVQVRWGSWPPLAAFATGQPGPGPGEVTLSVTVKNGSDYLLEHVRVSLDDPEGGRFVSAEPPAQGVERAHLWELPTLDRGVVGPMRATYRAAGPVSAHATVEFRHRRPRGCSGDDCLPAFVSATSSDSTLIYPADQ
jgi:methionine-rich copper-binding protein CopC